jgi:hypothetical protein
MGVDKENEPIKKAPASSKPKPKSKQKEVVQRGIMGNINPDDAATLNVGAYTLEELRDDLRPMLSDSKWKQPSWLRRKRSEEQAKRDYEYYYLNSLRTRYLALESDYRIVLGNYFNSAEFDLLLAKRIGNYLQTAKDQLEDDDAHVEDIVVMLNYVDQQMVGLYPRHYALAYAEGLAAELKGRGDLWGNYLADELHRGERTLGSVRSAIARTKEAINKTEQDNIIASGLQVERLHTARKWGFYVLGASLLLIPMLIRLAPAVDGKESIWANTFIFKYLEGDWARLQPWAIALCAAIFGAGGAYFSSLMIVRSSRVNLLDYREKKKDAELKMMIGGIAALILMTFLSWEIIPGITVTNAGGFLFLAFVAGFSERYFLRLLNIEDEATSMPTVAAPPPKRVENVKPALSSAESQRVENLPLPMSSAEIAKFDTPSDTLPANADTATETAEPEAEAETETETETESEDGPADDAPANPDQVTNRDMSNMKI